MDEDQDRMGEFAGWKEGTQSEEREPKEVFLQLSHIAISMSFDLIDKLRFFEKETLKLSDEEIAALAAIGKRVEEYYGAPQDIEWAEENGKMNIVQSRPITVLQGPPGPAVQGGRAASRQRGIPA